ncbi:unnamed protein product [Cyclocybe aegerita]|uniref:Calcium-transporting ATPase n=1 Tax=Cyclocybe aegerita TaxID=1973307 RepID=A0A8S0VRD5_CYCAE|nr:unnamed protein product [Cyclocybe aegerita]
MSGNLIAEIVEVPRRGPNVDSDVATLASEIQRPTSVANSATFLNNHHPRYLDPRLDQSLTDKFEAQTLNKVDLIDDDLDPSPFPFKPNQLASLVELKSLDGLMALGGASGVIEGLQTSTKDGIVTKLTPVEENGRPVIESRLRERQLEEKHESDEELPAIRLTAPTPTESQADHEASYVVIEERRRVYGRNVVPIRNSKPLLLLIWLALQDNVLILLSTAAFVSAVIGAFLSPKGTYNAYWVEGLAVLVGIIIIVFVGALNDWNRERQLQFLHERKNERTTKVIRDGVEQVIDVKDLVVGDVGLLQPGEILPCDGIFLSGHNVKCDESWFSGESDAIRKHPFTKVATTPTCEKDDASVEVPHSYGDCFILSGSKVLEGAGKYIVVAVGRRSLSGRVQTSLESSRTVTPLQDKLNGFATLVAKIGSCIGLALFIALLFRLLVQFGKDAPQRQPLEKGFAIVSILIVATVLVVVAVPQGLPLAAILSISFAAKRMFREGILVRTVHASEFLGGISVICSNKATFVNEDRLTVVSGTIGIHAKFSRDSGEGHTITADHTPHSGTQHDLGPHHLFLKQDQLSGFLPKELKKAFTESLVVNSTAFENTTHSTDGETTFEGSKTEVALLKFARQSLGMVASDVVRTRDRAKVVRMFPFSSERKCMAVVVTLSDGQYRAYFKGASEILANVSTKHVVVRENMRPTSTIRTSVLEDLAREKIMQTTIDYANEGLRTLALCYRDFSSWPPLGQELDDEGEVPFDGLLHNLTLLSVIGLDEPLYPDAEEDVKKCHRAGISIKLCTGDNVLTARSFATRCGIFTPSGIIMEGPTFRQLTTAELVEIVPRLQVLARSSAEDKDLLIRVLRMLDEIVSVTGKNANDSPVLRIAHVGFSMGISGTEVAKEASDIVLMDDNFSGIIQAVLWGRNMHDAIRKFLQMMVTVNVSAGLLIFMTAIASSTGRSVPSPVQLLWVNVIMDTFASLGLVTDPKTEKLLDRKPSTVQIPLFTTPMLKMILAQVVYQAVILFPIHFYGRKVLDLPPTEEGTRTINTLVFNTFVFCQIFNTFNCRSLDKRLNVFEGLAQNMYFMAIIFLEITMQTFIVSFGGRHLGIVPLRWREWCISIGLAFLALPLGVLTLYLPNKPFHSFFRVVGLIKDLNVLPTSRHEPDDWNRALSDIRAGLRTFSTLRGGRLRASGRVVPGPDWQYSEISFPRAARLHQQDGHDLVRSPPH